MQEFTLNYFGRLIELKKNLNISLEVSSLPKTHHTSAAGMMVFEFFRTSAARIKIHLPASMEFKSVDMKSLVLHGFRECSHINGTQ